MFETHHMDRRPSTSNQTTVSASATVDKTT